MGGRGSSSSRSGGGGNVSLKNNIQGYQEYFSSGDARTASEIRERLQNLKTGDIIARANGTYQEITDIKPIGTRGDIAVYAKEMSQQYNTSSHQFEHRSDGEQFMLGTQKSISKEATSLTSPSPARFLAKEQRFSDTIEWSGNTVTGVISKNTLKKRDKNPL